MGTTSAYLQFFLSSIAVGFMVYYLILIQNIKVFKELFNALVLNCHGLKPVVELFKIKLALATFYSLIFGLKPIFYFVS